MFPCLQTFAHHRVVFSTDYMRFSTFITRVCDGKLELTSAEFQAVHAVFQAMSEVGISGRRRLVSKDF